MNRWTAGVLGAGVLGLVACASSHKEVARVDDSGLARLNENQMEPVDEARVEEGRARDGLARAKAAEADARARLEVARSERQVAEAQLKRSTAERDLVKKQYAPRDQQARADEDVRAADDRIKATDIKLNYLNKLIEVAQADVKVAQAHVDTTAAKTEQAKFRAMKSADVPQVMDTNGASIDKRVADAQMTETQLARDAAARREQAVELYNRWQQVDARVKTLAEPRPLAPTPPPAEPTR